MPHKHKRRQNDETTFNLPPTELAKPLPVRDPKLKKGGPAKNKQTQQKNQQEQTSENTKKSKKAKGQRQNDLADDTPKAFRRLMQFQTTGQRTPSGLDTGKKQQQQQKKDNIQGSEGNNKKRKREDTKNEADKSKTKDTVSAQEMPKILPGEKLSDFAARVDRTLPLSAMKKSIAPGVGKMREDRQTRHEKHLRRLQQGWREEDARIREREQAEREERESEMEEQLRLWKEWEAEAGAGKKKKAAASAAGKKRKKGKNNRTAAGGDDEMGGHVSDDDDPDPWAKLKKRDRERKANPFDVVQAPPQLTKPREIFKVRGGAKVDVANVPAAVGSLRRREELAGERRTIVEEYRRLMAEKRG
ncbi:hypothetical protein N7510_007694 [Penicillium lagena]|uniref:uncharacterized protein n=1 Tax=Penicillium lagena TaxID=94218 RepID=UPI00254203A4|nr:uncharacterized protein N7510_007694 [Penicillium lagena]KAJ5610975.1 hypothetical protein N7510_007694 [Penicillium lagena]